MSLAFKTDKLTLEKRIDLHKRARDVAEQNIEREMNGLKDALKVSRPTLPTTTCRCVLTTHCLNNILLSTLIRPVYECLYYICTYVLAPIKCVDH